MKNSLVSVIIVNFNGAKDLRACLSSLMKITYNNYEVIIVDNGSTDTSEKIAEEFKKKNEKIKVIFAKNKKNLGFAEGNNIGLKHSKGGLILLLNNDTIVTRNFLTLLVKEIKQNKKIGIIQPKVIFYKTNKLQSGSAFLTNMGLLYYEGFGRNPNLRIFNKKKNIFSANGACILIKREVIKKTGLFDNDFFAYYEETDFCHRVLIAGYDILYLPTSKIYHKGGQTSKKIAEPYIFFHSYKNRLASLIKNFETYNMIRFLTINILTYLLLIIYYLVCFKPRMAESVVKALLWNAKNLHATMHKRFFIQKKIRQVSDSYYFPHLVKNVGILYYFRLLTNKGQEKLS